MVVVEGPQPRSTLRGLLGSASPRAHVQDVAQAYLQVQVPSHLGGEFEDQNSLDSEEENEGRVRVVVPQGAVRLVWGGRILPRRGPQGQRCKTRWLLSTMARAV